jgi:hypothetical protein
MKREGHRKCSAKIDNGRSLAGTLIKRLIGKTDHPAPAAGEAFHHHVKRTRSAPGEYDRELFLPGIVTGQRATTFGTCIPAVKNYSLACQNTALDDINEERGKA